MGEAARKLIDDHADAVMAGEVQVTPLRMVEKLEPVGRLTDQSAMEDYVASVPEQYVVCREGRRHTYPPMSPAQMRFTRTEDGYDELKVTCTECGMAYRYETWFIKDVDGVVVSMKLIDRGMGYHTPKDGESPYLAPPGTGYVASRDFREIRVSQHFLGKKVRRVGAKAG